MMPCELILARLLFVRSQSSGERCHSRESTSFGHLDRISYDRPDVTEAC